jgi:hypothetical protein
MMIQLQYRIPAGLNPSLSDFQAWRKAWTEGKPLPQGIRIRATSWQGSETEAEIKARIRKGNISFGPLGKVGRYARNDVLYVDVDCARIPDSFFKFLGFLVRTIGIRVVLVENVRTVRGWHVLVTLDRGFPPLAIVTLQAILGSDPYRETFNLARVLGGKAGRNKRWNLLFDRKVK